MTRPLPMALAAAPDIIPKTVPLPTSPNVSPSAVDKALGAACAPKPTCAPCPRPAPTADAATARQLNRPCCPLAIETACRLVLVNAARAAAAW
jgi:hypothetical protein